MLRAGWWDLLVAAALGAAVGLLQLVLRRWPRTSDVFLPIVSAFGVSVSVFLLARTDLDVGVFAPLIAPLVAFLPGALLTTAVIGLSTGQMISGAGRLATGAMQLVLLAFGIVAGAQRVGDRQPVSPRRPLSHSDSWRPGWGSRSSAWASC